MGACDLPRPSLLRRRPADGAPSAGAAVDSSGALPAQGRTANRPDGVRGQLSLCFYALLVFFVTTGRQARVSSVVASWRRGVVLAAEGGLRRRRREERLPPVSRQACTKIERLTGVQG